MTLEIVAATTALIAATEEWLDAEETAYKAGLQAAEESCWLIDPPLKGFRCNWDMVKRNWQTGRGAVHILLSNGNSIGFVWDRDILEVRPNERGKGYGRLLADFMVKRAFDEGRSMVKIEIAPQSAIPFWQSMGFTLVNGRQGGGGGCYAYRRLERKFPLGLGPQLPCSIEFFGEEEHFGGKIPFYRFVGLGELLPDNYVQLPERAICFSPEEVQGDPFARIAVRGKEIFYDKLKRVEGAQFGIQCDGGDTYYIERLHLPNV